MLGAKSGLTPAHVDDIAEGHALAMSQLARAAESLGAQLQLSSEALGLPADYTFWGTADKARRELGWQTRPIEPTLRAALETAMKSRAKSI